jgi:hypothetical protein
MDEQLTEFVGRCEELYDMSNKKYRDAVWKEKVWGQICEELYRVQYSPSDFMLLKHL